MKVFTDSLSNLTEAEIRLQVDSLLSGDVDAVKTWESGAFDQIAGDRGKSIVLFGAGGLGKKTSAGLGKLGIKPLPFADNNPAAWNTLIDDIPVLSPVDAAERFGASATFVITIWRAG